MFGVTTLSSEELATQKFDADYDIVIAGGGGAGLPAALFSRWLGNTVVILEKAPALGGTAAKAAFWYWVPNNAAMRAASMEDPKPDFLRYVARVSRPQSYDPSHPRFGFSDWEYSMCEAIYDSAASAAELLNERDALPYRHVAAVPDYWAELEEDKAKTGRVLLPKDASESMSDGGKVAVRTMSAAAQRDGIDIKTEYRVERLILNDQGEVVGAEGSKGDGTRFRIRSRRQ